MSHSAYKDLNILHVWLNNQKFFILIIRSFVKHKKQLTNIYDKLDVKSEKTLGLLNEEPKLSEHVIENSRNFHKKGNMILNKKKIIKLVNKTKGFTRKYIRLRNVLMYFHFRI